MKHDSFHIRPARAEDIPEIGRIVVRSWQRTFDGLVSAEFLNSMSDDHQRRRHERMFAIQGVVYYVAATNDGDVVGFCSGGPSRRPAYAAQSEIYAIYLMPGFERRGIGRRLFENVVADIAASGRKGLFLTALSVNPNRPFYTKLGGIETEAESLQLGDEICPQIAFVWDDLPTSGAKDERQWRRNHDLQRDRRQGLLSGSCDAILYGSDGARY
jgi:L-amino acid N-acyltransferase YncA